MNSLTHSFEVGERAFIDIRLPAGATRIEEGTPGAVTVVVSGRFPERLRVEQTGDHIEIYEDREQRVLRGSYRLAIEAPSGIQLGSATGSGDLDARCALGDVRVAAGSGDTRLDEVSGDLEIKVASGDVSLRRVEGRARVVSASGDLEIGELASDASLTTASGDMRVRVAHADLDLKSASGDLEVSEYRGSHLRSKTVSGDVVLRLPAGRKVRLALTTLSGDVTLPSEATEPDEASEQVRVAARSVSGDITIDRA